MLVPSKLLFSFRSYTRFRKGTCRKVLPHPTVGTPSASNIPSTLSARGCMKSNFEFFVRNLWKLHVLKKKKVYHSNEGFFWPICFYSLESQKSTISAQLRVEIAKLMNWQKRGRLEEIKRAKKSRCSPSLEVQISGDETENKK